MKKNVLFLLLFTAGLFLSASIQAQETKLLAFPGAEGFGRYTKGVRAASPEQRSVYVVTNLNDSGTGSLRDAVSQPNRVVVFNVSGVIKINSLLAFKSNIYVAGQTAPGDGIVVYGNRASFSNASNVIVRHMRFYLGSASSGEDTAGLASGEDMIFDHLSLLWAQDETFSINFDNKGAYPKNITLQNTILGQGLIPHSAGGLLRSDQGISLFRNIYIHNNTRNPNVRGLMQFVNNVVYNWGTDAWRFGTSGAPSWVWAEGNYFISGRNGGRTAYAGLHQIHQMYVNPDNPDFLDSNRDGVLNGSAITGYDNVVMRNSPEEITGVQNPFLPMLKPAMSAQDALAYIIDSVGASLPARTDIDDFLIDDLLKYGGENSLRHIAEEKTNGIYQNVGLVNKGEPWTRTAGFIPDHWKQEKGLSVNSNIDLQEAPSGYLWIEEYINSIDGVNVKSGMPYLMACFRLRMDSRTPSSITLTWKNNMTDADNLVLQCSIDGNTFTDVTSLAANTTSYTVTGLEEETFYTFRIISHKGNESVTSETARFSTEGTPGEPLACSKAIHPENDGVSRFYTSVEFVWENETGPWSYPLTYNVYLGRTPEELVKINDSPIDAIRFDYRPAAPLEMRGKYYWRVDAVNAHGTAEGPVWSFTTSSMSFTENFIDIGRNFTPPSTFTDPQSKVAIPNSTSAQVTVNGDRITFTRSGGSFGSASDDGVYRKSNNNTPTWKLTSSGHYVNIEPSNDQAKEKYITKVTLNGTDDKPAESGRNTPIVLFSDRIPFDGSRILGYEQVTISKCRGNVAGANHETWEPPIIVNAPVGTKSVRIYHTIRLNELGGEDGIQYAIASNGDINLPSGVQARLSHFSVMLEHISNDDPSANSNISTANELSYANGQVSNPGQEEVTIFNTLGVPVLTSQDSQINVQQLPLGLYIAKAKSSTTLKFIK